MNTGEKKLNGSEIKKIRNKMGLKQDDFAKKVGISKTYLSYLETEKRTASGQLNKHLLELNSVKQETPSRNYASDENAILKALLDIQSRLAKIESECVKMKDMEKEFRDIKGLYQSAKKKAG